MFNNFRALDEAAHEYTNISNTTNTQKRGDAINLYPRLVAKSEVLNLLALRTGNISM